MTDAETVTALLARVDALEHQIGRDGVGRTALGMVGNDVRVDCRCGGNLGLIDAKTATMRVGYDKLYVYMAAENRCCVNCRRCKAIVVLEHGQPVAYVDPVDLVRGWLPGKPIPDGLIEI